MTSRPLLDYLAYPDAGPEPAPAHVGRVDAHETAGNSLETRLKALEALLRASETPQRKLDEEATLAARIESILGRKAGEVGRGANEPRLDGSASPAAAGRLTVAPPPTAPVAEPPAAAVPPIDHEFLKFMEAVYLIGQAAKRFIEQPLPAPPPVAPQVPPASRQAPLPSPGVAEIEALSAVLRETVSAFRSVADDLAVSAGEIRNFATREERPAHGRKLSRPRYRDDEDEVLDLRESVAELQDRLDAMMRSRRRARY